MFDETLEVHPHEKTFKEDNRVRWISNSRQLNKVKRMKAISVADDHGHFAPCSRYKFFTKINVSIQYYTFELDSKS